MVAFQTIKDSTLCPCCSKTAIGYDSIIREFGLRNMENGSTIVQSWCRVCRKDSARVNAK